MTTRGILSALPASTAICLLEPTTNLAAPALTALGIDAATRLVHDDAHGFDPLCQGKVELAVCRDVDRHTVAPNPRANASNPSTAAG